MADPRYEPLYRVLLEAAEQAEFGKGSERHDPARLPFVQQEICASARLQQSIDGPVYQARKKSLEAKLLDKEAALRELRGAINYLAAAIIVREEMP